MFNQQSTIFPKLIKLDDYESQQNNSLIVLESSNLLLGTGSRTSTAAIVLAKTLHFLQEQGSMQLKNKSVLQFGCGVGLVGLYLAALGSNVALCDTPTLKDLVQKNINLNRKKLKGKAQYFVGSWKKTQCLGNCKQTIQSQTISTASSDKNRETCLYHLVQNYDLSLACQCGGISDLECQLKLMGKQGMILGYMKRQNWQDGLNERIVEQYLNDLNYDYQKLTNYHPDYFDNRISIFKIYPQEDKNNKFICIAQQQEAVIKSQKIENENLPLEMQNLSLSSKNKIITID